MIWNKEKKYYEILLNAEDDARQIRSLKNVLIATNEKGRALFGMKENPFSFLKDAQDTQSVQKLIDAYCTQTPIEIEIKTLHHIYLITIKKIKNGLLITAKDKSAEYAIHFSITKQLEFMSDVLSAFIDPIYLTDKVGNFIYVNKAFCTLIGLSFKEILGQPINHFIKENCPDFHGIWEGISSIQTPTGLFPFSIHQRPFEAGDCLYFCGVIQAPHALASHLDEYLFQESPLPTVIIDALEYHIIHMNKAFLASFQQEEENFDQANILDLLSENTRDILANRLNKLAHGSTKLERIEVLTAPEYGGKTFNVFVGFTNEIKDAFILYLVDASERKNLEIQFAHAQKMQAIGQLAGGIAHDFNNLLTAIIGFCDLLLQRHNVNDPSFLDIMQIKGNANKASGLVGQLLTFSRKQPSKIQVLNFHDAFVDLSALLQRSIAPFVTLKTELKRNLGWVKIDPNQLTQIFLNLAVNAKDAMKSGGVLKIAASKERLKKAKPCGNDMIQAGEYIKIIVSDTGCGISAENLPHIFEPFFTTKGGATGSGTGLGLSTVYGIIRGVGGYISVDSEKGIGTTFIIYLPQIEVEPVTVPENKPVRPVFSPLQTPTLLLVDDEDGVRLVVARVLKSKGFHVIECANAEQALEELSKRSDIDLLLTDMIMPGMDGETLIKHAREAHPKMKALLMSGYSEDLARHGSADNKELAFLAKPFELSHLLEKVKEVIEK